jgi:hypothetical protein
MVSWSARPATTRTQGGAGSPLAGPTGMNNCQISRITGISRPTIRDWRHRPISWPVVRPVLGASACPRCDRGDLNRRAYAYLLGVYLGDGYISRQPNGVFKLRISCANRYPGLIQECRDSVAAVKGRRRLPGIVQKVGCVEVYSGWNHWACLFPQHGPGRKHERKMWLADWQRELVGQQPESLLRGLLHSDGWRGENWVNGKGYPRYQFTNHSADIREIFCWACDLHGVKWRRMNWKTISVARSQDVAKLDAVVGPKF